MQYRRRRNILSRIHERRFLKKSQRRDKKWLLEGPAEGICIHRVNNHRKVALKP